MCFESSAFPGDYLVTLSAAQVPVTVHVRIESLTSSDMTAWELSMRLERDHGR